jgi:hypothetical protein
MNLYLIKYTGPFGYIKPWSAVRDELTYSQLYLTTPTLTGMEIKLGVNRILRHRINYASIARMQEVVWPKQYDQVKRYLDGVKNAEKGKKPPDDTKSILTRGVMIEPELILAFGTEEEQSLAFSQHLCLCRNEDVVLPIEKWSATLPEFEDYPGFEFIPSTTDDPEALFHGLNRFEMLPDGQHAPVYGRILRTGEPMRVRESSFI